MILLSDLVFGHTGAIQRLTQAAGTNNLPQSLLITGTSQLGKATLARALAMTLNCTHEDKPCQRCSSCRKLASGNHPDIMIFDASAETLKIEQIRDLQHDLSLRPHESLYKIAILCDFERATPSAANALLKTLEEPVSHIILILTAKNTTLLLPTIVSRCQIVPLMPLPDQIIAEILQTNYGATATEANLLSRLAAGRPGWAINMLKNPDLISQRSQYLSELGQLLTQNHARRFAYAQSLLNQNIVLIDVLNLWLAWWRDILLVSYGLIDQVVNVDVQDNLNWFAQTLSGPQIIDALQQTYKTIKNLDYQVNPRLNLEVLLLNFPNI